MFLSLILLHRPIFPFSLLPFFFISLFTWIWNRLLMFLVCFPPKSPPQTVTFCLVRFMSSSLHREELKRKIDRRYKLASVETKTTHFASLYVLTVVDRKLFPFDFHRNVKNLFCFTNVMRVAKRQLNPLRLSSILFSTILFFIRFSGFSAAEECQANDDWRTEKYSKKKKLQTFRFCRLLRCVVHNSE